ncbi:MAG TPA: hypothetical protein VKM55_29905 [Candidatus Lokiarchaeia archaeon]|nr:hypothetical protein [Candidatus Lokiarchaeia archaeon]
MNFTITVIFSFTGTIAYIYGFVVSVNQLRKEFNYRFYWFSAMAWFFSTVYFILMGVAIILLSVEVVRVAFIIGLLSILFVNLKADTLKREQVEPFKLAAFLVLFVLFTISMYVVPNAMLFSPDLFGGESPSFNPYVGLLGITASGIAFGYYCHCTFLVNKRAPIALKRFSRLYFAGTFLCTAGIVSLSSMSMDFYFILVSIGAPMMAYAYSREPKLLFVLPFTAIRLTVLETAGGIPLFTHTWNRQEKLADENLFSGFLQAISEFLQESLQSGAMQEIRVAEAVILTQRSPDYPVACVLVATRPTRSLRDGLKSFSDRFCGEFNACFVTLNDTSQFNEAEKLVTACFPHVPVYD